MRIPTAVACMCLLPVLPACALKTVDYLSPLNYERPKRPATDYIVLHTTEAPDKSSLNEIHQYGEANYVVDTQGRIYSVIERNRIATHAGRSMWDGKRTLDDYSIGIEVVGYHDKMITDAQVQSLSELLSKLKAVYGIADRDVLCHAMVAYGAPNRWHNQSHRGRKRCGALFTNPAIRAMLGLHDKWAFDPDIKAGRLVVGDEELQAYMYGARPSVSSIRHEAASVTRDNSNSNDGFRTIGKDGPSARDIAGAEYMDGSTIYFMANGLIRRGNQLPQSVLDALPDGTKMLVGYIYGGFTMARRTARDICGPRWNYPSTFYRLPDGKIRSGDTVKTVPDKTLVFFMQ